ncbi:MAG: LysM peptidoglycan-binding domain-containing protein [Desulfuromonadaceae bacterium]
MHYTVKGGENMYTIARQPFIYADGMLWPLIYGANRDQIKDPRQIYPGQILNIPRDISEKDMEQARTRAKESSIFTSEEEARSKK